MTVAAGVHQHLLHAAVERSLRGKAFEPFGARQLKKIVFNRLQREVLLDLPAFSNGLFRQRTIEADRLQAMINGLKREELIATNSMILHELFFSNLGDQSKPGPTLEAALIRDFGSVERWRSQFTAMGRAEGGGSGWVLLTYSPRDKRLVNAWAADHTTTLAGGVPILAMDMYEHAYQMDFGAKAANYVDVFMKVIRWETADRLYDQVSRA